MAKKTVAMPAMLDDGPASNRTKQDAQKNWPAVTCKIPPEDQVRLKIYCATSGQKQKDVLTLAISEYLDRND